MTRIKGCLISLVFIVLLLALGVGVYYLFKHISFQNEYLVVAEGEFDKASFSPGDLFKMKPPFDKDPITTVYFTDGRKYIMEGYTPHASLFSRGPVVVALEYRWGKPKVYPRGTKLRILQRRGNKKDYKIEMISYPSKPQPLPCAKGFMVKVPAKPEDWRVDVFTPMFIHVNHGDTILFSASGTWNVGSGSIGPDGQDDLCQCTVSEKSGSGFRGPLGALIGRIGALGTPFFIGSQKTITVFENGILFLSSNDNLRPCDKASIGSCYEDNRGIMEVCVEVKASKTKDPTIKTTKVSQSGEVEEIIKQLSDKDFSVRRAAAESLGIIRDHRTVQPLIIALKDDDFQVREIAAASLGEIGDLQAIDPLIEVLQDPSWGARISAAEALDKLSWRPKSEIQEINYLIVKKKWYDLIKIGEPAVEPLIDAMETAYLEDLADIAILLGALKDPRAVEPLIILIKRMSKMSYSGGSYSYVYGATRDTNTRESAIMALAKIGKPALQPLIKALEDDDPSVRQAISDALNKLNWKP